MRTRRLRLAACVECIPRAGTSIFAKVPALLAAEPAAEAAPSPAR
jgi:hypothetical protein